MKRNGGVGGWLGMKMCLRMPHSEAQMVSDCMESNLLRSPVALSYGEVFLPETMLAVSQYAIIQATLTLSSSQSLEQQHM